MDAAFLKAAVPGPKTILGKRLKPFCIGHELILSRAGNSFAPSSRSAKTQRDFFIALFVLSQPYRSDFSLDNYSINARTRFIAAFVGPIGVSTAMLELEKYIAEQTNTPDIYFCKPSAGGSFGTPPIQAVKVSLMRNLGMSESDALNTPYALAYWNHYAWAESQGLIEVVSSSDREMMRQADAMAEKIDAFAKMVAIAC